MQFVISPKYVLKLKEIVNSNDATFGVLASISELDPKVDFRFADLKDVDFQDSDIRGYDFTGADLLGAIKNSNTLIDDTTIFESARVAWIEAESRDIISVMQQIQNASSSKARQKLLAELQERYRSATHIRQFLITSMKKATSIEAFFDFANSVHSNDDLSINIVIRDELYRLIDKNGAGFSKGRRKLEQTPYGFDLIQRLLDEAINPFLREVAGRIFQTEGKVTRSTLMSAIRDMPAKLL